MSLLQKLIAHVAPSGPASLNKDENRELPACRVQMIALGRRGQSSVAGKEAMCKGVMASWPASADMVEGLEAAEAPVSICFFGSPAYSSPSPPTPLYRQTRWFLRAAVLAHVLSALSW